MGSPSVETHTNYPNVTHEKSKSFNRLAQSEAWGLSPGVSGFHRPYHLFSYSMVETVHILYVCLEFPWEATFASLTRFAIHGRTFLVVALTTDTQNEQ